jgi:hypothetical protein
VEVLLLGWGRNWREESNITATLAVDTISIGSEDSVFAGIQNSRFCFNDVRQVTKIHTVNSAANVVDEHPTKTAMFFS